MCYFYFYRAIFRDIAQPGRVNVWGACGRRFKAFPPDNVAAKIKLVLKNNPYYECSKNK
jgi:hypothetical protein